MTMFFACDVLHHLTDGFWHKIKDSIFNYDIVIIKDINCHYKFKNFMNKFHDRIINGEKIRDIDPDDLEKDFIHMGYEIKYYDMHKLWYPHFMIVARKSLP